MRLVPIVTSLSLPQQLDVVVGPGHAVTLTTSAHLKCMYCLPVARRGNARAGVQIDHAPEAKLCRLQGDIAKINAELLFI